MWAKFGSRALFLANRARLCRSISLTARTNNNNSNSLKATEANEQLRVATMEDYQAVLDLEPDGYRGLDYLPSTYPKLISGPGVKGFVFEIDNRVVGFMSTLIVDGGQTLVPSTSRVSVNYRGRGVFGRFKRRLLQQFSGSCELRYVAMTVYKGTMEAAGASLMKTYRITGEKTITSVEMDLSKKSPSIVPGPALRLLSKEDVHRLMNSDPTDLKHIFPQETFMMEWKPYRVMAENAEVMATGGNNRALLASNIDFSGKQPVMKASSLLSCGSYVRCKKGHYHVVDFFGTGNDEELRAHASWHMARAMAVSDTEEKTTVVDILYQRDIKDVLEPLKENFCFQPAAISFEKAFSLEMEFRF